jgi:F-type H+-transporting ATPase subunit b
MMFRAVVRVLTLLLVLGLLASPAVLAQEHGAAPPAAGGAQPGATHAAPETEHHEEGLLATVARLVNFAILVGVLVYFLKTPIAAYLSSRGVQIRQDLLAAAEMRAAATAQLEDIDRKLRALPAELEALRAQGAEDVRAEQARIRQLGETEAQRLIEQTRREIAMRLRIARRELTEYAAALSVKVAEERITRTITPDDQLRLVDRYTSQLQEAR